MELGSEVVNESWDWTLTLTGDYSFLLERFLDAQRVENFLEL